MPRITRRNRNLEVDFRGEKHSNATHASTADPDARLFGKSPSLPFLWRDIMGLAQVLKRGIGKGGG